MQMSEQSENTDLAHSGPYCNGPLFVGCCFNQLRQSDAYMRQYIISIMVQIMACGLFGAQLLYAPMLPCCPLDPNEYHSVKLHLKFKSFLLKNALENIASEIPAILYRPQCGNDFTRLPCLTCKHPISPMTDDSLKHRITRAFIIFAGVIANMEWLILEFKHREIFMNMVFYHRRMSIDKLCLDATSGQFMSWQRLCYWWETIAWVNGDPVSKIRYSTQTPLVEIKISKM